MVMMHSSCCLLQNRIPKVMSWTSWFSKTEHGLFKATLQNGYLRIRKEFRMDICRPPGLDAERKSDKQTLRQGHTSNEQRNAVTRWRRSTDTYMRRSTSASARSPSSKNGKDCQNDLGDTAACGESAYFSHRVELATPRKARTRPRMDGLSSWRH